MAQPVRTSHPPAGPAERSAGSHPGADVGLAVAAVLLVAAVVGRPWLSHALAVPAIANWSTVFVAVTVQALPFLVLGVCVSAAIAAFVPARALSRAFPANPVFGVPVAALAGAALPGCECGSVPIARRLMARGVTPAAALTFLLSAPAVNPVVLVSTAVAFPGQPMVVAARFAASMIAAVAVGTAWTAVGKADLLAGLLRPAGADPLEDGHWSTFVATARHDVLSAGGFLVIGAGAAATLQTAVPRDVIGALADTGPLAVLALAGLAVLLAICSEADAFVAAGLREFSPTARLAFMVVGPMVDVKLIALQAGTFGRRFTARFAPLTFVCAVLSAALVGWWLL